MRVLAKDQGTKGINANCVALGPTATELFFQDKSEELIDKISTGNPFNRIGKPEEIARVITYLSSEVGGWVNERMTVDT